MENEVSASEILAAVVAGAIIGVLIVICVGAIVYRNNDPDPLERDDNTMNEGKERQD